MIRRAWVASFAILVFAQVLVLAGNTPRASQQPFAIGGGESIPAEAGAFTVPQVRSHPGTGTLTLRYVRFRTRALDPKPPIVFLAGGPGDAATRAFHGMPKTVLESLTAIADVIAFDQRGTGTSDPTNVTCAPQGGAPLDAPLDPQQLGGVLRAQLVSCLSRLDATPFTTAESADDLADLARAIDAPKILLLAGSYGTHLALAAARQHPDTIAGMALLGVEGPDDTLKLPGRVDAVLTDIDRAHPGTRAKIATLIERLTHAPWTKTLPNGQRVTVGAWDLQRRVADALSTTRDIAAMVATLDPMMAGDYSDLVRWTIPFRLPRPMNLMHVATDCASYASAARLADIRSQASSSLLGDAINFPLPELCDVAGLPRLPDAFRAPVISSVPALLVAGTFDGRTPPPNIDDAARGLAHARTLVIPGASHGLFQEPQAMAAVVEFFAAR